MITAKDQALSRLLHIGTQLSLEAGREENHHQWIAYAHARKVDFLDWRAEVMRPDPHCWPLSQAYNDAFDEYLNYVRIDELMGRVEGPQSSSWWVRVLDRLGLRR